MEGGLTSDRKKIADVLTEGMDKAKQLRRHLCSTQPSEANDLHLQRIISSFEKALMFLNWGQAQAPPPPTSLPVDSSRKTTANESPSSVTDGGCMMKKRKRLQPVWTEQVKIKAENGLEGPAEDSYSWRKYGQKDILGAKYPRSYYRCTYRLMRHCWATKQVQRSDDDPTVFEVTYKGTHSCNHVANSAPAPESPQKLEQVSYDNKMERQMKADKGVDAQKSKDFTFTSALGCQDADYNSPLPTLYDGSPMSAYSSFISSPATSRGDHYRDTNYQMMMMMNYVNPLQHYETQIPDIVSSSNHTSTTDSPSGGGMEYSLNEVHPNLQFDFEGIFR